MFLGFTGPNAAGKGEAIKYLVDNKKFTTTSTGQKYLVAFRSVTTSFSFLIK